MNAYTAAECTEPLDTEETKFETARQNHPTVSPYPSFTPTAAPIVDDILIDDYIENWECCAAIHTFYGNHCHNWGNITESLLGFVIVMITCVVVKSCIQRFDIHWLPQSAGCILVGGKYTLI